MDRFYVYVIKLDGIVVYVGKGTDNRMDSTKNEWFNLFDDYHHFEREKLAFALDEREALTLEAQLIRQYNPVFNKVQGLTPAKWVTLDFAQLRTYIRDHKAGDVDTPSEVLQCIKQYVQALPVKPKSVLYACAGVGGLVFEAGEFQYAIELNPDNACVVMRKGGVAVQCGDFLTWTTSMQFDLIIMNPPFTDLTLGYKGGSLYWKKFVDHAQSMLTENGKLIAVLPICGRSVFQTILLEKVAFENASIFGQVVVLHKTETYSKQFERKSGGRCSSFIKFGMKVENNFANWKSLRKHDGKLAIRFDASSAYNTTEYSTKVEKYFGTIIICQEGVDAEPLVKWLRSHIAEKGKRHSKVSLTTMLQFVESTYPVL